VNVFRFIFLFEKEHSEPYHLLDSAFFEWPENCSKKKIKFLLVELARSEKDELIFDQLDGKQKNWLESS